MKQVLTPVLSDDEYRIVLTWGESPADLDSHLVYYKDATQIMHVYYANKNGFIDGKEIAKLDYDDTSSYGPETVTIILNAGLLEGGLFSYYVHDFSNSAYGDSSELSESNAVVRVYKGNELIQTYNVPQNKRGIKWDVFAISKNGLITYNEIE